MPLKSSLWSNSVSTDYFQAENSNFLPNFRLNFVQKILSVNLEDRRVLWSRVLEQDRANLRSNWMTETKIFHWLKIDHFSTREIISTRSRRSPTVSSSFSLAIWLENVESNFFINRTRREISMKLFHCQMIIFPAFVFLNNFFNDKTFGWFWLSMTHKWATLYVKKYFARKICSFTSRIRSCEFFAPQKIVSSVVFEIKQRTML